MTAEDKTKSGSSVSKAIEADTEDPLSDFRRIQQALASAVPEAFTAQGYKSPTAKDLKSAWKEIIQRVGATFQESDLEYYISRWVVQAEDGSEEIFAVISSRPVTESEIFDPLTNRRRRIVGDLQFTKGTIKTDVTQAESDRVCPLWLGELCITKMQHPTLKGKNKLPEIVPAVFYVVLYSPGRAAAELSTIISQFYADVVTKMGEKDLTKSLQIIDATEVEKQRSITSLAIGQNEAFRKDKKDHVQEAMRMALDMAAQMREVEKSTGKAIKESVTQRLSTKLGPYAKYLFYGFILILIISIVYLFFTRILPLYLVGGGT